MSFETFCNICFMKQNIIKLREEENEHIFNILITFTSCPDLVNGIIYLCTNCCIKLEEYDKFKQLFLTNFVRFRYLYNEHRKKLEMHNEPNIEMQLKSFVDINVERPSGTPLIENYAVQVSKNNIISCKEQGGEFFKIQKNEICTDTSFSPENNKSESETHMNDEYDSFIEDQKNTRPTAIIKKYDEEYNEFTNTDNVATSIPYDSSTYESEDKYFETEDIKLEKVEPYFSDGDYKEFMKSDDATSIPYSSSTYDSSNLRAAQTNFERVDVKIEKDEANSDPFEEPLHNQNVSDSVGSVTPCHNSENEDDDSNDVSTNSKNYVTEDATVEGGSNYGAKKTSKIRAVCKVCNKGFRVKSYLQVHMRLHTGERPFACDECEKTFINNWKLISHKRTHSGEKPYNCDDCNVKFRTGYALKIHKRTHTGEKPYSCDECKRTFRVMDSLRKHKRIHSGEKPYQCGECETRFATRESLYTHRRTHVDEKPYSCDECPKAFKFAASFWRHKRVHKGEKPYECEECGFKFIERWELKKHKLIHPSEKPSSV